MEVRGIEPLCSADRLGLLRAQRDDRVSPLGVHRQRTSGPDRMRCPPPASGPNQRGKPAQVIPDPRPQAHGAGSYLTVVKQRARTRRWRLYWSGVLRDIRDHGPLLPDDERPSRSQYTPICSCLLRVYGRPATHPGGAPDGRWLAVSPFLGPVRRGPAACGRRRQRSPRPPRRRPLPPARPMRP